MKKLEKFDKLDITRKKMYGKIEVSSVVENVYLVIRGGYRMEGRDFSCLRNILSEQSFLFLENKGEGAFLEHTRLSEMYFESIWSVKKIRHSINEQGMQFEPSDVDWYMDQYRQMLFDTITFYNMGNAIQLYRTDTGDWETYSFFLNDRKVNNQYLSAIWYIEFFRKIVETKAADGVKLGHLLFLNALSITGTFKNRLGFISVIHKCATYIEDVEGFCDYSAAMGKGIMNQDLEKGLMNFIRKEVDYFLALPVSIQQKYFQYISQIGILIKECEECAGRQKNYGLIKCDFDDVLQMVI